MNVTRFLSVLLAVASILGCKNSKYCDSSNPTCPSGLTCDANMHACVVMDGGAGGAGGMGGAGAKGGGGGGGGHMFRCDASTQCMGHDGGNVCEEDSGKCVGCTQKIDCTSSAKPVCDMSANACVQCIVSKDDCSGMTPICDAQACRACAVDADCVTALGADPGVCMPDGHCAAATEVVYAIQPTSSSCSAATGLLTTPYCTAQAAVDKASTGPASIVVLRGGFGSFSASATTSQVTVVGQSAATINPLAGDGIDVSGTASLYIRNLAITGGTSTSGVAAHVGGSSAKLTLVAVKLSGNAGAGVAAENGASIIMDRCVVTGSGFGAPADLKTTASSFKITNCVLASSSSGATLDPAVPTGGTGTFKNNTLVGNAFGLSCTGSLPSGLIFSGNTNDTSSGCTPPACCSGSLLLTSDYHLMLGSPCIDVLQPDSDVPDDIDGQSRPFGAKSDCGADEYEP